MQSHSKIDTGHFKIHKNVISSIAETAALEIEGVKRIAKRPCADILSLLGFKDTPSIKIEFNRNDDIKIEIPVVVKYGCNISAIAEGIQDNVRRALEKMADKSPRDINISIQGIEK